MNGRTATALLLALPLALILGLLLFLGVAEEDNPCLPSTGTAGPALFVDPASVPAGPIAGYGKDQLTLAATIMLVARDKGLSVRDQQIGVMAAMGESSLTNPEHGDAVRNDTIGLFQIGPEHGTYSDRMNPSWAAGNFFDRLIAVPDYQNLPPTIAAHRAQRNADPYHYEKYWASAVQVVGALGGIATAAPMAAGGTYNLGPVQPQLAAMVNVLGPMFNITTVGGYRASARDPNGHPAGLAADFMVPLTPAGQAQGDALAAYAQANAGALQVDYILWRQRIWSVGRANEGWRAMEDRGDATQNHFDHVHINAVPVPGTTPGTTPVTLPADCLPPTQTGPAVTGTVVLAQANIKTGMAPALFAADLATTIQNRPDFVTLNEVNTRSLAELSPPGYEAWRDDAARGQQRSTAIAWRTDTWTRLDSGRIQLVDNGPQKWDPGRSATWATFRNTDGQSIAVVSVHHMINPAKYGPDRPRRQQLYAEGLTRLQSLLATLGTPVLVGGDFNTPWPDANPWGPTTILGRSGLQSDHAALGVVPTGDAGATVDYIFYAGLTPTEHHTYPLNSDHNALIATFG